MAAAAAQAAAQATLALAQQLQAPRIEANLEGELKNKEGYLEWREKVEDQLRKVGLLNRVLNEETRYRHANPRQPHEVVPVDEPVLAALPAPDPPRNVVEDAHNTELLAQISSSFKGPVASWWIDLQGRALLDIGGILAITQRKWGHLTSQEQRIIEGRVKEIGDKSTMKEGDVWGVADGAEKLVKWLNSKRRLARAAPLVFHPTQRDEQIINIICNLLPSDFEQVVQEIQGSTAVLCWEAFKAKVVARLNVILANNSGKKRTVSGTAFSSQTEATGQIDDTQVPLDAALKRLKSELKQSVRAMLTNHISSPASASSSSVQQQHQQQQQQQGHPSPSTFGSFGNGGDHESSFYAPGGKGAVTCYNCGGKGHLSRNCPSPPAGGGHNGKKGRGEKGTGTSKGKGKGKRQGKSKGKKQKY